MSKINCDVCGTVYPETASQCPICGCVRSVESTPTDCADGKENSYTYVKGGRFSRSNVRKRNQGKPAVEMPTMREDIPQESSDEGEKQDKGLLVAVCILLLTIVAVVIYIITRFFAPDPPAANGGSLIPNSTTESVVTTTQPMETTEPTVPETEEETVPPTVEETVEPTQSETQPATEPTANNNYYVKPFKTNKDKQGNDASTPKGTSFPLKLFDATGELMDVDWLVEDPTICSVEGNMVTGLKRGVTKVYVVIDGETYYCIVRVT